MRPCFDSLRRHLSQIVDPLQGHALTVNLCVLAQSVGTRGRQLVYDHRFLGCNGVEALRLLYGTPGQLPHREAFFTADASRVTRFLLALEPNGNEDLLLALDLAADLPFGDPTHTCRVIALFSDEPIEMGAVDHGRLEKIPLLMDKLARRRIKLFAAIPESDAALELSQANGSEFEFVSGGDGLKSVDFSQLLAQMGLSISVMSLQSNAEPAFQRAVFGQDRWDSHASVTESERDVVLALGESARFGRGTPLTDVKVRLRWTRAIDLDLHAFYALRSRRTGHVYFGCKDLDGITLDTDAGIGDRAGRNAEIITVADLSPFRAIIFATKIYGQGDRYSDYDGSVEVCPSDGSSFVVPLSTQQRGKWCEIARIDLDENGASVANLNKVSDEVPGL